MASKGGDEGSSPPRTQDETVPTTRGAPSTTRSRKPSEPPQPTTLNAPDRVYPIRSMVSVDPSTANQPVFQMAEDPPGSPSGARQYSIIDDKTWDSLQQPQQQPQPPSGGIVRGPTLEGTVRSPPAAISPLRGVYSPNALSKETKQDGSDYFGSDNGKPPALLTSRFEHVETEEGHAVVTGRAENYFACEDEPIRLPGAVQSFGVMVAFREEADESLCVRVVSENSESILGYTPNALFKLKSFCEILSDGEDDTLLDHVDMVKEDAYDPEADGPEVFILSIKQPAGKPVRFWCAIHVNPSNPDLIICEFELEDDHLNPPSMSGQATPTAPTDTLGVDPTQEQLAGSTINISQPLRALRSARRRRGEAGAMEVFNVITQIQDQLARAQTLDVLLNTSVGIVKALTGFHRIMIYQFDSQWNGFVVSELVDPKYSRDLYKGLHFPATDIPKQARDLYRINKVRLLYDRDQQTSRLVCRTLEDLEHPIDMTHSYLRAMSPIHIKYLGNMGVRGSMSISINTTSSLWGLISCHSYGAFGMRVTFPIRKMCRLIGDTVSRNIERLSYASRLQARKLINTVPTEANPSGYIVASSDDLLKLFEADYGALSIKDETKMLGESGQSQEILALLEYLRVRRINSVLASHNVIKDFPDLHYPPGFKTVSGMLYVPLSTNGTDFMAFFRKGHLTEIKWGGNPYEKKFNHGHLEPRKSFQVWSETVLDQSREWTESEVETAAVLCLVYGKFIKVWRQNESAMQGSQLTKLLLANSAHEVRTPLNAVINYLEIALEGALDTETRDNLTKSHSASKSLIYVINDLLDLTNTEKGQDLVKNESFDLSTIFMEATTLFDGEAKRKGINYTVNMHPGLPKAVLGDERRVRQTISNLVSNAFQHTSSGDVTVDLWRSPESNGPGQATILVSVLDTGKGMSQSTVETLFQELEQVSAEDVRHSEEQDDPKSLKAIMDTQPKRKVLGLGLALVSRIIHNMNGQLSVRSEEGKGSRFQIALQFTVAGDPDPTAKPDESTTPPHAKSPNPLKEKGEFMLVDSNKSSSNRSTSASPTSHSIPAPATKEGEAEAKEQSEKEEGSRPAEQVSEQVSEQAQAQARASSAQQPSAPTPKAAPSSPSTPLRVLVAEDDPINGKIVQKRLGKQGHTVRLTTNGEECALAYRADSTQYDVVLMDIQMPIVDGFSSTKMIRSFEAQSGPSALSSVAAPNGHIPIFAVSATLQEKDASVYQETGFDGWILKPINFNRLTMLFEGLQDVDVRNEAAYGPGMWEKGGWFARREKN